MSDRSDEYDLFLSHGTPDKPWVRTLADELERLGLRVFLDERDLKPGQNWVLELSKALATSRYLVLVLSTTSADRRWTRQEWTSFMAKEGPSERLIPVKIDPVELPPLLEATQALDGLHRDASRVAAELYSRVGDPTELPSGDVRRLYLGRHLVFSLTRGEEHLHRIGHDGQPRQVQLPWRIDNRFGVAWLNWQKLCSKPNPTEVERAELSTHARTLGELLFSMLFDARETDHFRDLIAPGKTWRPVVTVRTDDELLLALPWELLYLDGMFLVRDQRIDVVRTTAGDVAGTTLLKEPTKPFRLVVNVSAPAGSTLSYEAESYRITLALADQCEMVPTELGTVGDLVETVGRSAPRGVHFSGHGGPGTLQFENDEGGKDIVSVAQVLGKLRARVPDEQGLPAFFYLASCHGNTPGRAEVHDAGSMSSAAQLHRAGITQVVGYFGPIGDELSTRAEETLYGAIAEGLDTRQAVRRAREALVHAALPPGDKHRPSPARSPGSLEAADTALFAWAQLVLYHRGPEFPLSTRAATGEVPLSRELHRTFDGTGDRRVLRTGFIGRRVALHGVRRRMRRGERVLVFQGLGGLGKSTLAAHVLPMLGDDEKLRCTLWCQETEADEDQATALVNQLLAYCRRRFGGGWERVVQQVDRIAQEPAERFLHFLYAAVQNLPRLVLHFDNLESLLVGPDDEGAEDAFGTWASPALEMIWKGTSQLARDTANLYLVASTRYRHADYADALVPVPPLPRDALFRLTAWFPALRRLSVRARARLVTQLDGHPRAVEYANDLVQDSLQKWIARHGEWRAPRRSDEENQQREWHEIVEPALPRVDEQLRDNLLLAAIWKNVLGARARRMLYRMTVLRRPAERELLNVLGEEDETREAASATAERLIDTSLLERMELLVNLTAEKVGRKVFHTLHPATKRFVEDAFGDGSELRLDAHRQAGDFLEQYAKTSPYINTDLEAAHHLLRAGRYDRAYQLAGHASEWLQGRGRVREGLDALLPFLSETDRMAPQLVGRLFGTLGMAYGRLGQAEQSIEHVKRAVVVFRRIGDRHGESRAVGNLGVAYMQLGQVTKSIEHLEQQLQVAREIGDSAGECRGLGNLGNAYGTLGRLREAIEYYEQTLELSRATNLRDVEGNTLGGLGNAYYRLGQAHTAVEYYEKALVIAREVGDRHSEGAALGNLGNAFAHLGQQERAIDHYEQQLSIVRETGDRIGESNAIGNLGTTYGQLGEAAKCIRYLQQQLAIAREIGHRVGESNALGNLGLAYGSIGELDDAIRHYDEALVLAREVGDRSGEAAIIGNLGAAYALQGQMEKSVDAYVRQLSVLRQVGDRSREGGCLLDLAAIYEKQNRPTEAAREARLALQIGQEISDPDIVTRSQLVLSRLFPTGPEDDATTK